MAAATGKTCSRCRRDQPRTEFYKHKAARDGLQSNCRTCHNETSNRWNKSQPAGQWRREWYLRNKEKISVRTKKWSETNRHKRRMAKIRRRTVCEMATPKWANLEKIAKVYRSAVKAGLTVDHIVPLNSPIVCGLHVEHNLQLLSLSENSAKRNHHWPDMP